MFPRKTIGLALGSGAIRGLAHIGVIKTLIKNNIPIDYIAGTSIGAWVGAHYALYKDIKALEELTVWRRQEKLLSVAELSFSGGLIRGRKVEKLLNEWLNRAEFKDLKIPLRIVATDLIKAEPVIFSAGSLAFAARASMSIPGLFKPIAWQDKILVDGGVTDPVPDGVVRDMGADIVIAVNVNDFRPAVKFKKKKPGIREVAIRTGEVFQNYLAHYSIKTADIVIQPPLGDYSSWGYFVHGEGEAIVKAGETAMEAALPRLLELMKE